MSLGKIISFLFALLAIGLLVMYWFIPFSSTDLFIHRPDHSNFTINSSESSSMMFYPNLRYVDSDITYKIDSGCPIQKTDPIRRAFDIVEEDTILNFQEVNSNEEITIKCDGEVSHEVDPNFFVAGEGGITNATITGNFNVIKHGTVLLLKESKCEEPVVAIHEIFHALGFSHSDNPNNIMYEVSKCYQEISLDMIDTINQLYSYPTQPDIVIDDIEAKLNNRLLDINISIRNYGLANSQEFTAYIYTDDKIAKEFRVKPLDIGTGQKIIITDLLISKINVDYIEVVGEYPLPELNKENNRIKLELVN